MITDPLFYAAAVPAVILLGLAKGGFSGLGALSLPLMALVVSPVQAAAITLPILIVQDVVSVWAYRHTWDRRNVVIMLLGAISGIVTGYLLAAQVSDAAVKLAVGVISVAFAVRRMIVERRATPPKPAPADVPRGIFWGWVTGFTSMVAHAGGPPFQIYVMPQRLPRDIFVGTGAILFALINWIKVPPYLALGQFTAENMTTAGALFPVAIASTWAGVLLVRRVSGQAFYTAVYVLLILVGAKLIYDGALAYL
ncbi:sulfite exporter TauE/SafE family protein [Microvirga lotononidis]|uniref:Probable membrane transporter protein n=1 Tax=Microvirga lotononidis TaxID=864069 RepID=I4YTR4_9HYPH|nr:sulfite exporter TauE/SafE family protein [Microvirga lotononidis]EIM27356.1 putative permease [Microvirga lotononidis]WQO28476.1 sulfite exporter TauE/SafE family protein [Microvirga lotononidis]